MNDKPNIILEKSFAYALVAIAIYKELMAKNEFVLSKQFVRAATSVGANIEEATAAYSKKEFASKMSIASKEARESRYWLRLLIAGSFLTEQPQLINDINEIVSILTAIVKTAQGNNPANN